MRTHMKPERRHFYNGLRFFYDAYTPNRCCLNGLLAYSARPIRLLEIIWSTIASIGTKSDIPINGMVEILGDGLMARSRA